MEKPTLITPDPNMNGTTAVMACKTNRLFTYDDIKLDLFTSGLLHVSMNYTTEWGWFQGYSKGETKDG